MLKSINFFIVVVAIVVLRLIGMAYVPLTDTSEPRYAEIARLMVTGNDWITLWFEPGTPFWGKPPLAFWLEALSFKMLGINEFAVRLPSLLATLATLWLLWRFALQQSSRRVAQSAVLIYLTTALVFLSSGAVLTDPFLTLGVTWSLTAFCLAVAEPRWYWRYGFFLGLAIGLLAKGPLALVLVFAPITVWAFLYRSGIALQHLRALPWLKGSLLTLLISLPWYVAAELKTPGFLNYFIVGEHFMRFIDPGWGGDMYGTAHKNVKGAIWGHWVIAAFPWGFLAIVLLLGHLFSTAGRSMLRSAIVRPVNAYLLLWALFTPVFFTPAGNVLWTYILPSLPAFALLLAMALEPAFSKNRFIRIVSLLLIWLVPLVSMGFLIEIARNPHSIKSEKSLVEFVRKSVDAETMGTGRTPTMIYYLGKPPFSARFYAQENVRRTSLKDLCHGNMPPGFHYVAIPRWRWQKLEQQVNASLTKLFENNRYVLTRVSGRELCPR